MTTEQLQTILYERMAAEQGQSQILCNRQKRCK